MKKAMIVITMGFCATIGSSMPLAAQQPPVSSAPGNSSSGGQIQVKPPSFPILFPNPTNNNCFEEFVRAADLIQNIDEIDQADSPGAELALKRRVLNKPECKQALELLREGLNKPAIPPKRKPQDSSALPIGSFIRLGHLLAVEQYVDFADGRVDSSIESLHAGLAFGYRIQCSTIISGLVGIIVDTTLLNEAAAHVDQLSVFNCDNLVQIIRDLLAADCPAIRLLDQEKSNVVERLDILKADPANLLALVADDTSLTDSEMTASLLSLKERLTAQPSTIDSVIAEADALISSQFDTAIHNMRVLASQRIPLATAPANSPGGALSRRLTMSLRMLTDRYSGDRARIRLLGVHALIRRYQWDHNALPGSLADLKADDLITDPFTGVPLTYKKQGDRYTLTSAGPISNGGTQRETVQLR